MSGAFAGTIRHSTLRRSYAHVTVSCRTAQCGLLAAQLFRATVHEVYAVGARPGRLLTPHCQGAALESTFYDCTVAGGCGTAVEALETTELQDVDFLTQNGWDFLETWSFSSSADYPCLRWEDGCGEVTATVDETLEYPTQEYTEPVAISVVGLAVDGEAMGFVDELVEIDSNPAEIGALLADENLELIDTDAPQPGDSSATSYLTRTTASTPDCAADWIESTLRAVEPEFYGDMVFSSSSAQKTICAVVRLLARGVLAGPVFPLDTDEYTRGSDTIAPRVMSEWPNTTRNVFDWNDFAMRHGRTEYGIPQAWEALEAFGRTPAARVAVADAGFSNHDDLYPGSEAVTLAPSLLLGGGAPPAHDRANFGSPYHGTGAAATVAGNPFNDLGSVGTAGRYIRDFTAYRVWLTWSVRKAMRRPRTRTSDGWRPAILSISLSWRILPRPRFLWRRIRETAEESLDRNVLIFSSAGNTEEDVDQGASVRVPCAAAAVVCVGGLRSGSDLRAGGSSFGSEVDIFAPYQGIALSSALPGYDEIGYFNGTSYATPFVAGVAALVWAADPSLTAKEVRDVLFETAFPSPDPTVNRIVAPYRAVVSVLPERPPLVESLSTQEREVGYGTPVVLGARHTRGARPLARATWTNSRTGRTFVHNAPSGLTLDVWNTTVADLGSHPFEVSLVDSLGRSTQESFVITIVNEPPTVLSFFLGSAPNAANPIPVSANVWDPEGDLTAFRWFSSVDGHVGSSSSATTHIPLSVGVHDVTLIVEDGGGEAASLTEEGVIVTPDANTPLLWSPSHQIAPAPFGQWDIALAVEAFDHQDGELDGVAIVWTDDRGSTLGTGRIVDLRVPILYDPCSRIYTATGTDIDGNSYSVSVSPNGGSCIIFE